MTANAALSAAATAVPCPSAAPLLQNPDLPADVFTACLTTPIKVALRWFCSRSLLKHDGEGGVGGRGRMRDNAAAVDQEMGVKGSGIVLFIMVSRSSVKWNVQETSLENPDRQHAASYA